MKKKLSLLLLGLAALLMTFALSGCDGDLVTAVVNTTADTLQEMSDEDWDDQGREDPDWEDGDIDEDFDEDFDPEDWDDEDLPEEVIEAEQNAIIPEDGRYNSKEDVALYIHTYGELPDNFITKKAAEKLGWSGGSLEPYAPGMSIGGSRFGNYEGLLPEKNGRVYTECDIDTKGAKSRGAKRIVFSNDGLIYYTDDHYKTFTLLYGEE